MKNQDNDEVILVHKIPTFDENVCFPIKIGNTNQSDIK